MLVKGTLCVNHDCLLLRYMTVNIISICELKMNDTTLLIKTQTYCFLSEVSREVCGFVTQDWIRKLIIWNMYGQSKPLWKQIINVLPITGGLRSSAIILQNGQLSSCKIKSKLLITQSFLLEISFSILHDREGSNYTKGHFRYRDGPHWCCLLSVNHFLKIKYISGLDLQGTGYVMHPNIEYADELTVEWIAKLPWFEMPHRSRDIAHFFLNGRSQLIIFLNIYSRIEYAIYIPRLIYAHVRTLVPEAEIPGRNKNCIPQYNKGIIIHDNPCLGCVLLVPKSLCIGIGCGYVLTKFIYIVQKY